MSELFTLVNLENALEISPLECGYLHGKFRSINLVFFFLVPSILLFFYFNSSILSFLPIPLQNP
jgi:hypothetical protein